MSDKLKSGVSVVPEFNDGEQPSAIKFSAIGAQVKLGFSLLEDAIGDLWGESYPYSSASNTYLNTPWGRQVGSNVGVSNLPNQLGRPGIAVNLARLIGPAANLNPQWLEGSSSMTSEEIDAGLYQFTLLYPPSGAVTFGSHGGALATLQGAIADLDSAGDYYISGRTVWCVSPTVGGTTAGYSTNPSSWGGGGNYQGARFNVIPDPNQIASLSVEQLSIAGPAADGSYTIQLPKITHQQANANSSSSALSAALDPNFDKQLQLPTALTDNLIAGDIIPDGFMFLRNNTTREVYRNAVYEYSDANTFIARSIDLGAPAEYSAQEFSVITVGTDITTSIDDLRRKAIGHNHDGAYGERPIRFEDLVGGQKYAGASGVFTKSEEPSNFLPQYLHRDGYQGGVDVTVNDENIMRGDLVLGALAGTPGNYLSFGVSSFGVYFGQPGLASNIKQEGLDLVINAQPFGGGGVDVQGEAFFNVDAIAITETAAANFTATATAGDVNLTAGTDVQLNASNDIQLNAIQDILQSVSSGRIIKMYGGIAEPASAGEGVLMDFDRSVSCSIRSRANGGGTEDVLDLHFSSMGIPGVDNSWVNFYSNAGAPRGRISGAPSNSVAGFLQWATTGSAYLNAFPGAWPDGGAQGDAQFISGNADYGEWLPIGDTAEWAIDPEIDLDAFYKEHRRFGLPEGVVVWVRDGQIWKDGGGTPMIVTCRAILVGNDKDTKLPGEVVSFIGQVPVLTHGPVNNGDYLVPIENHCVAVSPDSVSFSEYRTAVGTAWGSSDEEEYHRVLCAIGKK